MTPASPSAASSAAFGGRPNILRRAEAWLDAKGRGAWIAAMVLAFIAFWPVGLALVFYMTYTQRWSSDKMFNCTARRHRHTHMHRAYSTSGNAAFDGYKTEMLKRLEDEQIAFEAFLQRLRDAKDKSEFDAFMHDRAKENRDTPAEGAVARTGEY